ncbi:hypothetical protein DB30_05698 [Enhygromyxa salina]|uniref:Uncharacterized protein n=1 Tax=Enhygromyxa salina TaxID=215803 RepID=A0A0C2CWE6_9BACT|nr:hypothetical protein DB30_05698 [Enhygromyxa salina]
MQANAAALVAALCPRALGSIVDPLIPKSIVAALRWVFGRTLELEEVEAALLGSRFGADELGMLDGFDMDARCELVRAAMVVSLADQRRDPARTAGVRALAEQLGVSATDEGLEQLSLLTAGKLGQLRWRMLDHSVNTLWGERSDSKRELWWQLVGTVFTSSSAERAVASRFVGLGLLPPSTVGWALHRHYRVHGLAVPGEGRGVSDKFVAHELAHVLTDYPPHPYGEMLLAAFHAGNTPALAIELLLRALLQYHHGIRLDDAPTRGLLVPDDLFRAYARGHATRVDLHHADWNALLERDLDEVRRELGLSA